jgi:hypothetical protein
MKTTAMLLMGAVAVLGACDGGTGPAADGTGNVTLSVASRAAGQPAQAGAAPFMAAASDTLTDPQQNELILTRVEIVLREIELERISDDGCDSLTFDDDSCEKFATGPILLEVPLNGDIEQLITIEADTGVYDEVEFDMHKVSNDDPEDAEFRQQHPDMVGKSIRVQGSFNGQPFTYETDIDEEQEYDLVRPLVIDEMTEAVNVTLSIDVDAWFRDHSGALVNPQSANKGGANESLVNENIKQSFEAFEDDDHDGESDDD